MSTTERMIGASLAPNPSTSLALVPLRADHVETEPVRRPDVVAMGVHRAFFAMWYLGVALFPIAAWVDVWSRGWTMALFPLGSGMMILGGLGVAVRTFVKPRMRKLRQALGAGAALVLAVACMEPLQHAALEVRATGVVADLQPVTADLARHEHIRAIGRSSTGWLSLNGVTGQASDLGLQEAGAPGVTRNLALEEVMARDGVTRGEFAALTDGLRAAGIVEAQVRPEYLAFRPDESGRWMLLYVRPGHVIPRGALLMERQTWQTQPLGGGWYLVL